MEKREAALKAAFMRELEDQLPYFVVQLFASAGSPDRSITGNRVTTHWEGKHGTPGFVSHGIQELFCMRLALQGHCRYVLWQETASGKDQRTLIVHPKMMHERRGSVVTPEAWQIGYDMRWLVTQVRKAHGL